MALVRRTVVAKAQAYTAVPVACIESGRLTAIGGSRRRRIRIGLPQQGQANAGRGLCGVGGRGTILSTSTAGGFVGVVFGLHARSAR